MKIMDFRSDTVTKPSEEMRRIMASAEVGDAFTEMTRRQTRCHNMQLN